MILSPSFNDGAVEINAETILPFVQVNQKSEFLRQRNPSMWRESKFQGWIDPERYYEFIKSKGSNSKEEEKEEEKEN